jgi:hypothetical protein
MDWNRVYEQMVVTSAIVGIATNIAFVAKYIQNRPKP